ncbi:conjugative transposon protein TcpC [Planifilum fimeticola]|uniref:Conjugative transposon protein TcpC n=1 Tax=Planifilum fimeticola TaxID=201975 RepID=A0A2T0LED6_9BACL|nr:conjugal transfer protein [Planifilum fimeticola]PRX40455.1 conjugative transposon protein TcpC [Planifilum fimeticola]
MYWRRVRMIVITAILLFLAAKGAYDILHPPRAPAATDNANAKDAPVIPESRKGAENYAVYFTHFWLTGNLEEAKKFAAAGFDPPPFGNPRKVENIIAWDMRSLGEEKVTVTVRALLDEGQIVYLSVPVTVRQNRFGVIGLPTFVPEPTPAEAPKEKSLPQVTDSSTTRAARSLVDSFFRQYTKGTPQDLALLFSDSQPRRVLSPSLKAEYEGLERIEVSQSESDQLHIVARVRLTIDGEAVPQSFEFQAEKSGNRWLIKKTIPEIPRE